MLDFHREIRSICQGCDSEKMLVRKDHLNVLHHWVVPKTNPTGKLKICLFNYSKDVGGNVNKVTNHRAQGFECTGSVHICIPPAYSRYSREYK